MFKPNLIISRPIILPTKYGALGIADADEVIWLGGNVTSFINLVTSPPSWSIEINGYKPVSL